jgi:hypothetical protein
MTPEIKAIKELTETIRHFGKAASELAYVVAGCADNEIGHPRNHATLSRLANALRDCAIGIQHTIDAAPAAIKEP